MATDVLSPSSSSERNPKALDRPAMADGISASFGALREATAGDSATVDLFGFPSGIISPASRTSAKVRILGSWDGSTADDRLHILISKDSGATFQLAKTITGSAVFPRAPAAPGLLEVDVTSLVAAASPSAIRIRIQFAHGDAGTSAPIPEVS